MKHFPVIITVITLILIGGLIVFQMYQKERGPEAEPQINDSEMPTNNVSSTIDQNPNMSHTVTIETNLGTIEFMTYDTDAPNTVANFIKLAENGFYDGVIFHRVIPGFMIQGGDPTGTGAGGPGYTFEDELDPETESYQAGYQKGVVAMANAGPNTQGSQFFIMVADYPLPNSYTIFGRVVSGQEVADAISEVETNPRDKPLEEITMEKVTVRKNN